MKRRRLLAALGTSASGLAGCQSLGGTANGSAGEGRGSDGPETDTTTRNSDETTETGTPQRYVSVVDTTSPPAAANLAFDATLERDRVTANAPARLTVGVTNTGPDRATTLADSEYCHLFDRTHGLSEPRGLHLYREANTPDHPEGRWTRDADPSITRTYVDIGCGRRVFASGETITTTCEVWDDYRETGYYPAGTYRFGTSVPLWDSTDDDGDPEVVEWTVEVEVSDPD